MKILLNRGRCRAAAEFGFLIHYVDLRLFSHPIAKAPSAFFLLKHSHHMVSPVCFLDHRMKRGNWWGKERFFQLLIPGWPLQEIRLEFPMAIGLKLLPTRMRLEGPPPVGLESQLPIVEDDTVLWIQQLEIKWKSSPIIPPNLLWAILRTGPFHLPRKLFKIKENPSQAQHTGPGIMSLYSYYILPEGMSRSSTEAIAFAWS